MSPLAILRLKKMEQFYQILKLRLGATEKQIKQAYENLANIWRPEELSKYPYLQRRAYERMQQIELAYEMLVREYVKKNNNATNKRSVSQDVTSKDIVECKD